MKKLIFILCLFVAMLANAANPSFQQFDTNTFIVTNGVSITVAPAIQFSTAASNNILNSASNTARLMTNAYNAIIRAAVGVSNGVLYTNIINSVVTGYTIEDGLTRYTFSGAGKTNFNTTFYDYVNNTALTVPDLSGSGGTSSSDASAFTNANGYAMVVAWDLENCYLVNAWSGTDFSTGTNFYIIVGSTNPVQPWFITTAGLGAGGAPAPGTPYTTPPTNHGVLNLGAGALVGGDPGKLPTNGGNYNVTVNDLHVGQYDDYIKANGDFALGHQSSLGTTLGFSWLTLGGEQRTNWPSSSTSSNFLSATKLDKTNGTAINLTFGTSVTNMNRVGGNDTNTVLVGAQFATPITNTASVLTNAALRDLTTLANGAVTIGPNGATNTVALTNSAAINNSGNQTNYNWTKVAGFQFAGQGMILTNSAVSGFESSRISARTSGNAIANVEAIGFDVRTTATGNRTAFLFDAGAGTGGLRLGSGMSIASGSSATDANQSQETIQHQSAGTWLISTNIIVLGAGAFANASGTNSLLGKNYISNNIAPFITLTSPSPAVVLGTPWTNTYGQRLDMRLNVTITDGVGGSAILNGTNTTTGEVFKLGNTFSLSGTQFDHVDIMDVSPSDILFFKDGSSGGTPTASVTVDATTLKLK